MTIELMLQAALLAGSVMLGLFCLVLARRLRRLNDLETGLGGAIAVMAAQVDRLERAIVLAKDEARAASEALAAEVQRARRERAVLELRQKIACAAGVDAPAPEPALVGRRLRKRIEAAHA